MVERLPTNKELRTFLLLCNEFIQFEKKKTKDDGFAETGDLAYLYRFICRFGWRIIGNKGV